MKRINLIPVLLLLNITLFAQERINERVYVHLDKECYIAGEDIWIKFLVVDRHFQLSTLSSVGYIEISDMERPHVQWKLALEKGKASGKINIPEYVPTGIYQLTGYTRYMMNESDNVFFKRQIAIVNMTQNTESNRMELTEEPVIIDKGIKEQNMGIVSDKKEYLKRSKVSLSVNNIPADIIDLTLSVVYNGSIVSLPVNNEEWRENVFIASPQNISNKWLPEYEGHIVSGKIRAVSDDILSKPDFNFFETTLACVGEEIKVSSGRINPENGETNFYTEGIYGAQEIVTSVTMNGDNLGYRMEIASPFEGNLPLELPKLQLCPGDKDLMYRFINLQYQQIHLVDSLENKTPINKLYNFAPIVSYNLDDYTRFNTVGQTLTEFVLGVAVRRVDGKRKIKVFKENEHQLSTGNTLVLLDGVPIYNHQEILDYNSHHLKKIDVYGGKYMFGGEYFDCMVSFITFRGNLPSIQLESGSELLAYTFPELSVKFEYPDYDSDLKKKSLFPDFRHTLFWEPFGEDLIRDNNVSLSFYTSDMVGEYNIILEGITKEGRFLSGTSSFLVIP